MLANHKGEIPFFTLLIPFLIGVTTGLAFNLGVYQQLLLYSFLTLSIVYGLLNWVYRRFSLYRYSSLGGILLNFTLVVAGSLFATNSNGLNDGDHFSKTKAGRLMVQVSSEPKRSGDYVRFVADVKTAISSSKAVPVTGKLMLTMRIGNSTSVLNYGDQLLIPASYQLVDAPFNPAEFNYKNYLAHQRIYHQLFLSPDQLKVIEKSTGNPLIAYALKTRQHLVEKLKANMQSPEAIAVASTLILGYKADLSDEVLQAYSQTGTIHVLSVSGAHVGMILYLLTLLLGFFDRIKHGRLIRSVIIITLIWAYALLTGFSPAVCRAAVMITFFITGKTYNRHINNLNILAASAFFLLLYDPLLLADVGFQLSYLAVFGLVTLQPVLYKQLDIENKGLDKLWVICSASIAIQVITFPLSAYYFHQFPVYFLISNLFIIIPSAVIMYAGVFYLLLSQIPWLSKVLAVLLESTIIFMNKVLSIVEHSPFAYVDKIWLTNAECVLGLIIATLIFYYIHSRKTIILKYALGLLTICCLSISWTRIDQTKSIEIVCFNLRKHTGLIFRSGNAAVVFTDLNATDKAFRYSVKPYLDSCHVDEALINKIDTSITTPLLRKQGSLVQFKDKRMLIVDKGFVLPSSAIVTDYLYITGNPKIKLSEIDKLVRYQLVILNSDNSNRTIARFQTEDVSARKEIYTLKRNKALRLASN